MNKALFFIALLGLTACVSDLDIPLPAHQERLVVQSRLVAGEPAYVYLTHSYAIDAAVTLDELLVRDATVEIWTDGARLETLTYRDTVYATFDSANNRSGRYASDFVVEAGRRYELRITHPDYPAVRAEALVPAMPEVLGFEVIRDTIVLEETIGDFIRIQSMLRPTVQDPAGVANFYDFEALIAYRDTTNEIPINDTFFQSLFLERNLGFDVDGNLVGDQNPVSDSTFDGMVHTFDLLTILPDGCCFFVENSFDLSQLPRAEIFYIDLRIRAVEPAISQYLRQLRLQRNSNLDGIASAILPSEPVTVGGNIEGGEGFFAGEASVLVRWTP